MRIALLCNRGNMYCGGQGVYTFYLAQALQRLGHEVEIVVGPPYPDVPPGVVEHRVENLNFFEYGFPKAEPFRVFTPLNLYELASTRMGMFSEMTAFSVRAFDAVRRRHRERPFDIIHDNQTLGYGILLMKSLGVPVVATIHHPLPIDRKTDLAYLESPRDRWWRIMFYPFIMQHMVARRMERVIVVSHSAADETHDAFGVARDRIRVVYNGIDIDAFRRPDDVAPEPGRLIVVCNTRDRKKGVVYLLGALRILRRDVDARLTIVDWGLPENEYTPGLVRRFGLDGCVEFTGKVSRDELVRHYARAQVAVVPSLYEGFGLPAAEAMALGLPVVSTTAGALPEVVGDDAAGALVPPRDAAALAAAIRGLLQDEALRREAGVAGRKRVETMFTWENAARQTLDVYQEVM
ncbi:MAG: glycosyltransferase family 4 protein [Chloroflexota bacterium]|nr:glycosyltransferase family 4 protein [Chloroflexota bacterium]